MFKKRCENCESKINKKYNFCPNCGMQLEKNEKDYGLIGETNNHQEINSPETLLPGFGSGMLDKMLSSAMKMLEKEIKTMNKETSRESEIIPPRNMQLYVNGKKINLGQPAKTTQKTQKEISKTNDKFPMPDQSTIIKAKNLPRQETSSSMKRINNKIVYELDATGTKTLDKILINKLEQGYEIKMFTKNKVLTKNINIALPLNSYSLRQEKLFLEFEGK